VDKDVLEYQLVARGGGRRVGVHHLRNPCSEPRESKRVLVAVEKLHVEVRVEVNSEVNRCPRHGLFQHQLSALLLPPCSLGISPNDLPDWVERRCLPEVRPERCTDFLKLWLVKQVPAREQLVNAYVGA
jgi:hypothetical protein